MNERAIADCFDEKADCCTPKVLDKRRNQSGALADALEEIGLAGLDVLEIGSGVGELTREVVRRGARAAKGIDLSPQSVDLARNATQEEGLDDKITFIVGNGATSVLEPHDVVVLDRVICCYPHARELVDHTAAAATRVYAFKLPRYERPLRLFWKIAFGVENAFHFLRRRDFRAYLHTVEDIDRWLRAKGFVQKHRSSRRGWLSAVYVRTLEI